MTIQRVSSRRSISPGRLLPCIILLLLWAKEVFAIDATIVWQEDFTLIPLGAQPPDWTIAAEPKTACQVVGMPGSIDKVLKLNSLAGTGTLSAEKRFTPSQGVVFIEWRFFESESGRGQTFIVENGKGKAIYQLFVDSAGNLCLNDSGQVVQPGIVANQWYKVKVLLRTDAGRCDLSLNDIPISSEVPFSTAADEIAGIRILSGGPSRGILQVTDFKVSSVKALPERTVRIHLDRIRQGIDGVGFCHEGNRARKSPYVIDEFIQDMLDNKLSLFRDRFPGKAWEPTNDNGDPFTIAMKSFTIGDSGVITTLQRLKEMQNRGIKTILGVWDVADWMVSNPEARKARKIKNIDEFAESVCAFLRHGREKYGLTVDFVDVNETEPVGIRLQLTAAEYGSFIKKCGALLRRNGLTTRVNIGSTLKWGEPYIAEMYSDPGVRTFGGYPSYHSYRGTGTEPNDNSTFIAWGKLRRRLDRNLWCTETDYDAYLWENPERSEYRSVTEMAYNYWRIYYLARTSATAGWFWRPKYPSHEVHRAYMNFFEPGGTIVEASQNYPGIYTVAYKHPGKKKFVLQVLNASARGGPVTFSGVPDQPLTLVRTSRDGDRFTTVGTFTPVNHRLTIVIKGDSFNTLHGNLKQGRADP
ncbi:MAG: hypothetical protein JW913_19240 [Chitinispirillaceae bacterium]|nr:hypothetical protein [Chitinispirillaceae bacterium]